MFGRLPRCICTELRDRHFCSPDLHLSILNIYTMLLKVLHWLTQRETYRGPKEAKRMAAKVPHCWRESFPSRVYALFPTPNLPTPKPRFTHHQRHQLTARTRSRQRTIRRCYFFEMGPLRSSSSTTSTIAPQPQTKPIPYP